MRREEVSRPFGVPPGAAIPADSKAKIVIRVAEEGHGEVQGPQSSQQYV